MGVRRIRIGRLLAAFGLLAAGLVLALPAPLAGAAPFFPGGLGNLRVTFDNTGAPGFNTGPAALGVGAFRMDTGSGTGSSAGGKVFIHSSELDGQPVTDLDSFSYQYYIDPTSPVALTPYANLRVDGPLFSPSGARTLLHSSTPGAVGAFTTLTVATGSTSGWTATGQPLSCNGQPLPAEFSLEQLATICPGTNIVPTSFGTLGGISVVTGETDGAQFAGWTGVIDDLRINSSQYDLEPARVTITPASPVSLTSRAPQTVTFTLQASGWNTFLGSDTTGQLARPILSGYEIQVGYLAVGGNTVTGLAGTVPVATQVTDLASPPPPITFTLDVTSALIGSLTSIPVNWVAPGAQTAGVAVNASTVPATTVLQLPAVSGTSTAPPAPVTPAPATPAASAPGFTG